MSDDDKEDKRRTEWKLPQMFEEKREELYLLHTRLNMTMIDGDPVKRDNNLGDYLERVQYIIGRVLPKLSGEDIREVEDIEKYAREYLQTYGHDPPKGLDKLNTNHRRLSEILFAYEFDRITPVIISL